jgi:hypothetical protein
MSLVNYANSECERVHVILLYARTQEVWAVALCVFFLFVHIHIHARAA